MANLGKEERNRRFIDAVDYLIESHYVLSQKELASRTGIMESTFSNVRQNRKSVSDKTIYKVLDVFPGIFNVGFFKLKSCEMLMQQSPSKSEEPPPASLESGVEHLLTLAGQIIKENENLRRELKEQLAEVHSIIRELKSMMPMKYGPSQPGQSLLAAEE